MTTVAPPPGPLPSGRSSSVTRARNEDTPSSSRRSSAESSHPVLTVSTPEDDKPAKPLTDSPAKAAPLGPPPKPEPVDAPTRPPIRPGSTANRSKFDLEPNVFEASFASRGSQSDLSDRGATPPRGTDATAIKHNALPPLSSLTSPAAADPNQFPWLAGHSLRSGPLSPAMLAGPAQPSGKQDPAAPSEGAFDPSTFRTGFTPGTGSGFTPGFSQILNGNFGALPLPSPNTAAFLNSITNSTPVQEAPDPTANAAPNGNGDHHLPPTAIPPHLQHNLGSLSHAPPQQTITPNTLSALTGVMNHPSNGGPHMPPSFYPPAMHPGASHGLPPPGHVDYAQQSANAASQAANGLFLLTQAHQELTKREEENKTPLMNKRTSLGPAPGSAKSVHAGTKRKSDAAEAPKGKKGKKGGNVQNESPPMGMGSEDHGSDDDDEPNPSGRPETEEEKRKNFLERNRQAALKCRQRKKAWLGELQSKVETLSIDNERLQQTVQSLHDEVNRLTSILMQHRDCGLGIPTLNAYGRPLR
ncbi:Transcription factor [Cryptotrichosporon argae]